MRRIFTRNILNIFALLLLLGTFNVTSSFAQSEEIAVVVNEDAITVSDVTDRATLIIRSSGMPDNPEIRAKLNPQIIGTLVDEQIMKQEAKRLDIEIKQGDLDQGFAVLAKQNNVAPEQFEEMLKRSGVNINTMYNQIEAQMAWGQAVQKIIRPKITVTDADIDDAVQRMRDKIGKTEYLVAGIVLPIEKASDAANIREMAYALTADIRAGKVPFSRVAQQFSKSAGANQGGDMGWIQEGQLEKELEAPLAAMQPGQISEPIKTQSGYSILMLREKRSITEDTIPSREELMNMIGTERLERMQRRHLQDLKTSAFIDSRV